MSLPQIQLIPFTQEYAGVQAISPLLDVHEQLRICLVTFLYQKLNILSHLIGPYITSLRQIFRPYQKLYTAYITDSFANWRFENMYFVCIVWWFILG